MKADYIQRGESIDYINTSDKTIAAGDVVVMGTRSGVAGCAIPKGAMGSVHTVGVFLVPKASASDAIEIGDNVFYGEAGAVTEGDAALGWAVEPSPAGVAEVKIKL